MIDLIISACVGFVTGCFFTVCIIALCTMSKAVEDEHDRD